MRKIVILNCLVACGLIAAGCGDDSGDGDNGGSGGSGGSQAGSGGSGGSGGGAPAEDPINSECPAGIAPAEGAYAQKGACCYRTSNSSRVASQTGDKRVLEYRMKYFLTANHQATMGALSTFTINRYDREEQSVLYRLTVPWADGKMAAGMGTFQVGPGRYNCDKGTYSFYSKTAAPVRGKLTDQTRWESATVPVVVKPDGATVAEQIKPVWAENMKSRIPSFTPYLKTDGDKPLEWESSSQAFQFESSPRIDDKSINCVGSRNETTWEKGGVVRVYVRVDSNNLDPIMTIGGVTLAQLQAFGTSVAGDKDNPANNPETAERCMPGAGCKWLKLPESLCPVGEAEQMSWDCHVGWADNPDKFKTNCTQEKPTGVLDPDKGATSQGQCCDPLGKSTTIPKCNSWVNLIDYVAAAADITDELANEVQQNCMK